MHIKRSIERIPGGMMVLPLLLGTMVNSFFPEFLKIGGFVTALSEGAGALVGAFLFCMGAGIKLRSASKVLKKGVVVTVVKFAAGTAIGLGVAYFFKDSFLGLSSLAIIAATTNSNGGLYAALVGEYGDETDVGAISVLSLNDGPFFTMLALGITGLVSIPLLSLAGVVIPILMGMILGNLDEEMEQFLTKGGMVLIPIFAFSLGCTMNLSTMLAAGLSGVVLALLTTLVIGPVTIWADRLAGGSGIAGAAAASTAGNAVATPAALLLVDPQLTGIGAATAQVAAASILTVLITPLLTNWVHKQNQKRQAHKERVALSS